MSWGEQGSIDRIRVDRLAMGDHEFWFELAAQAAVTPRKDPPDAQDDIYDYFGRYSGLGWVADVGVALRGLPSMLEVALDLARAAHGKNVAFMALALKLLPRLRQAIAASGDEEHEAVIALLERQASSTALDRLVRAYLCPHRADWVALAVADGLDDEHHLLKDCVMSAELAQAYLKRVPAWMYSVKGALLLQAHLHGDAAFPLLAQFLSKAQGKDSIEAFLGLLLQMQVPPLIGALAAQIETKEVRAALEKLAQRYPAAVLETVIEQAFATRSRLVEGWAVRMALREPAALAAVMPALDQGVRARFAALLAELRRSDAAPEQLPPLLRDPPWLGKSRAGELPTLALDEMPLPDTLGWSSAERARHAEFAVPVYRQKSVPIEQRADEFFDELKIEKAARERLLAGGPLLPQDVWKAAYYYSSIELVLMLPADAGLAVWNGYPPQHWSSYVDNAPIVLSVLARFGEAAMPGLVRNCPRCRASRRGRAGALDGRFGPLRHVAGVLDWRDRVPRIEPWALGCDRLVVPDFATPAGALAPLPLGGVPASLDDPCTRHLERLAQHLATLLHNGTRRLLPRWARESGELARDLAALGFQELSQRLLLLQQAIDSATDRGRNEGVAAAFMSLAALRQLHQEAVEQDCAGHEGEGGVDSTVVEGRRGGT